MKIKTQLSGRFLKMLDLRRSMSLSSQVNNIFLLVTSHECSLDDLDNRRRRMEQYSHADGVGVSIRSCDWSYSGDAARPADVFAAARQRLEFANIILFDFNFKV